MDVEDEDYKFALQLQQQESKSQSKEQGVLCSLTNKRYPSEQIYILDDCSHKFEKAALIKYISASIMTQVNVKCPFSSPQCKAEISVRDMKELSPKDSSLVPKTSSKQASQRITSELKHILSSNPEAQGYSVQTIKDNLYLWEVCTPLSPHYHLTITSLSPHYHFTITSLSLSLSLSLHYHFSSLSPRLNFLILNQKN
jgi:hypothetical protein